MPLNSYRRRLRPMVSHLIMFIFKSTITPKRLSVWQQNTLYIYTYIYNIYNSVAIKYSYPCPRNSSQVAKFQDIFSPLQTLCGIYSRIQKHILKHYYTTDIENPSFGVQEQFLNFIQKMYIYNNCMHIRRILFNINSRIRKGKNVSIYRR